MAKKFAVIFDNGGGTTLQVGKRGFVHHYDDAAQAAKDVRVLMDTDDTNDWEGNEPEFRQEYNQKTERNGGYLWHDRADVKSTIQKGHLSYSEVWGGNMGDFYKALGVTVEEF